MSEKITMDELAKSVHDLTLAVRDVKEGTVDQSTVEAIKAEVATLNERVARPQANGFSEGDFNQDPSQRTGQVQLRADDYLFRSAGEVAGLNTRVSVQDVEDLQRRSDNAQLVALITGRDIRNTRYYNEEFLPHTRAMDTQTAGEGAEWVRDGFSASFTTAVENSLRIANLFPRFQMPSVSYTWPIAPVLNDNVEQHPEQTADTGQLPTKKLTPTTAQTTLLAKDLAATVLVSKNLEEDAILPVVDTVRRLLVERLAKDIDLAILNGDTDGTHQDAGITGARHPQKQWEGLRKIARGAGHEFDASGAASLTPDHLLAAFGQTGAYGLEGNQNVVHIVSMEAYVQLLGDDKVTGVDKFGSNATILSGQLAQVYGTPIVVTDKLPAVDATGKVHATGSNNTKGIALTVARNAFVVAERKGVTTELNPYLWADFRQDGIQAVWRGTFGPIVSDTDPIVVSTINAG